MATVFIGVDPHKLSVTIEVVDDREKLLGSGRFDTDKAGFAAMRKQVRAWPDRVWAVEGSNGAGRPLAQRLLADGEHVVDVPAKLSARARLLDTGHNRKTDAHDAHAVALVAARTRGLRVLSHDTELEALRILVARREELARQRVQTVNRLQRLLSELTPGKAKKDLTALQAKRILASVRPRDLAGKTRKRLALEQLIELIEVDKKVKELTKELKRRISDALSRQLTADAGAAARATAETSPGGHRGASHKSSAASSHPHTGTSDQPLPGPAPTTLPAPNSPRKSKAVRHLEPVS